MAPRQLMLSVASSVAGLNLLALAGPYYTGVWVAPTAMSFACLLSYLLWSLSRLQQALFYLRGELHALSGERSFLQRPRDINEIYSGLHFLVSMLPMSGWSVSSAGSRLVSWGKVPESSKSVLADTDSWQHWGDQSGIALTLDDDTYQVYLYWNGDDDFDPKSCALLDSLVSNFVKRAERELPKAPEAITDAIRKLKASKSKVS